MVSKLEMVLKWTNQNIKGCLNSDIEFTYSSHLVLKYATMTEKRDYYSQPIPKSTMDKKYYIMQQHSNK